MHSIKSKYVKCRKLAVQPIYPHMADLPKKRANDNVYPFKSTRIDYVGPFEVTVMRSPVKHLCCLFTCLVSMAVHIKVVNGLDTDACMIAITRIMARRDKPQKIISDNGTNFVGAAQEFQECFSQRDEVAMCERLALAQIVWKFNPPGAPHFGGIWEMLLRSCLKAMFAILENQQLTFPVLATTMCVVEQTLIATPLTPVSDDAQDLEALKPNLFSIGSTSVSRTFDA